MRQRSSDFALERGLKSAARRKHAREGDSQILPETHYRHIEIRTVVVTAQYIRSYRPHQGARTTPHKDLAAGDDPLASKPRGVGNRPVGAAESPQDRLLEGSPKPEPMAK